jgi:hypothetical protein
MEFSQKDLQQISEHCLSVSQIEKQVENFIKGFPFVNLEKPAVIGDGMLRIDEDKISTYIESFEKYAENSSIIKFVPASGAATRMFKDLYDFKSTYNAESGKLDDYPSVKQVLENIKQFAFYGHLQSLGVDKLLEDKNYLDVINLILEDCGLGYGQSPKAVILFHKYENLVRTAFEEHLVEASEYCVNKDRQVRLHFTISENHRDKFSKLLDEVRNEYENTYNCKYDIGFSYQKSSTDTVAVNKDNTLARDENDNLIFRPAGHGALIENLNEIDADIVFIKNIDNVIHDKFKESTYKYKKLLAGILVWLKGKIDSFLNILNTQNYNDINIAEISKFCVEMLALDVRKVEDFEDKLAYRDYLLALLDRPIRVCGMVKNENQPGGGPFWVRGDNDEVSLQIVESAQVDMKNDSQKNIFNQSTHFNPVDLVCSVKNFRGEKFDLTKFVDYQTGFITEKTQQSQSLKVQELPGLWNGSMANWISVFVEIPLDTFTPVKVLNNLLDKGHNPDISSNYSII